jgi:hypothetical protein
VRQSSTVKLGLLTTCGMPSYCLAPPLKQSLYSVLSTRPSCSLRSCSGVPRSSMSGKALTAPGCVQRAWHHVRLSAKDFTVCCGRPKMSESSNSMPRSLHAASALSAFSKLLGRCCVHSSAVTIDTRDSMHTVRDSISRHIVCHACRVVICAYSAVLLKTCYDVNAWLQQDMVLLRSAILLATATGLATATIYNYRYPYKYSVRFLLLLLVYAEQCARLYVHQSAAC